MKGLNLCKEAIFYDVHIINWFDQTNEQKMKIIMSKFNFYKLKE